MKANNMDQILNIPTVLSSSPIVFITQNIVLQNLDLELCSLEVF
jgi:hypothetical protein